MFDVKKFKEIIKEREYQANELDDEWDYGINKCCNELIELLTIDMSETIAFIKTDCTDKELWWMCEVFDDVVIKTQSNEFVSSLKERAEKVIDEDEKDTIFHNIKLAETQM